MKHKIFMAGASAAILHAAACPLCVIPGGIDRCMAFKAIALSVAPLPKCDQSPAPAEVALPPPPPQDEQMSYAEPLDLSMPRSQ